MKIERLGGAWVASVTLRGHQLCAIGGSRFAAWRRIIGLLSDEALSDE